MRKTNIIINIIDIKHTFLKYTSLTIFFLLLQVSLDKDLTIYKLKMMIFAQKFYLLKLSQNRWDQRIKMVYNAHKTP